MRTISVNLYSFEELSEEAKQKAIQDHREIGMGYKWCELVEDSTKEIGKILGIEIREIYFELYGQGSGACFEGSYHYAPGSKEAIRKYAPQDPELHRIADQLEKWQKPNFYQLYATVKHTGLFYHPHSVTIDVMRNEDYEDSAEIEELLRDFMRWIYKQLESEYEYLTSDEAISETLIINEYEFTENGEFHA